MAKRLKLFMVMVGCNIKGRVTEQHDIFFGVANKVKDLMAELADFWPEAEGNFHIDAWREVTIVDNFSIEVVERSQENISKLNLYFLNLGGYKAGDFDEYHYKMLTVASNMATAVKSAKQTTFYKEFDFKGALSHIDEKYGVDVDDTHKVADLLNDQTKQLYSIKITALTVPKTEDVFHIGYLKLKSK